MSVPSEQEVSVTVKEEPEAAEGVNTQPVAVPAFEKSEELRPETAFENSSEKESAWSLVGETGSDHWADAGPRAIITLEAASKEEVLPASSEAAASANLKSTLPSEQPLKVSL